MDILPDDNDSLAHHGVKGMHWGVRKAPLTRKEQKARNKRRSASDARRQISDSDLKSYIERLQNEKKLKELVEQDLSPGRAFAKKVLSDTGKKTITTAAAGVAIFVTKSAFEAGGNPVGLLSILKRDKSALANAVERGGKPKK